MDFVAVVEAAGGGGVEVGGDGEGGFGEEEARWLECEETGSEVGTG